MSFMGSLSAIFQIISVAAMLSFGHSLIVRSGNAANRVGISCAFSGNTLRAWFPGIFLALSAEAFHHHVFSEYLQRTVPGKTLLRAHAVRNFINATELLLLVAAPRVSASPVPYVFFAASFFSRMYAQRRFPHAGTLLFGIGLFLLPLLHAEMILTNDSLIALSNNRVWRTMFPAVLFLTATHGTGFLPLMAVTLFVENVAAPAPLPTLACFIAVLVGSAVPLITRGARLGTQEAFPRTILWINTLTVILFVLFLFIANISLPMRFLPAAAFLLTAALETIFSFFPIASTTVPQPEDVIRTNSIELLEQDTHALCTRIEYIESATAILFSEATINFSTIKTLIMKLQNAGTLADQTQTLRKHITHDAHTIQNTAARIRSATYILIRHHPDRDHDIRQDTILRITRYTEHIAGKIINLGEYFDRLRKKNAFFSQEESMAVTELLAMVHDITGYVSDYLAGRIHNLDATILSRMEEQIATDAGEFRTRAMVHLSCTKNAAIRTNLTLVESIETIESIVRDLDRIATFAARL